MRDPEVVGLQAKLANALGVTVTAHDMPAFGLTERCAAMCRIFSPSPVSWRPLMFVHACSHCCIGLRQLH